MNGTPPGPRDTQRSPLTLDGSCLPKAGAKSRMGVGVAVKLAGIRGRAQPWCICLPESLDRLNPGPVPLALCLLGKSLGYFNVCVNWQSLCFPCVFWTIEGTGARVPTVARGPMQSE